MDRHVALMLLRLSRLVIGLVFVLLGIVMTVDLPYGRAGRGVGVLAALGGFVAIVLVVARLTRIRQPGHPLARLAPELLYARARTRVTRSRARASAVRHRRRRGSRVREAELAAITAAEGDERLAPERITSAAEALLRLVYVAWDARDRNRLATLLSCELLPAWERVLDAHRAAGERHRTEILGGVRIDLVGLTVDGSGGGTAIVLIEAELRVRVVDRGSRASPDRVAPFVFALHQYWTLSLDEGPMIVLEIEERAAGDHHLSEPIAVPAAGRSAASAPAIAARRRSSA